MVQDPTKKHKKHDPDMEAIFQGVRNLRAQEDNEQVNYNQTWYLVSPTRSVLFNTNYKPRCSVTNPKC